MPQAPSLFRCFFPCLRPFKVSKAKSCGNNCRKKTYLEAYPINFSGSSLAASLSGPLKWSLCLRIFFRKVDSFFFHPTTSVSPPTSQVYFYCLLSSFISLVISLLFTVSHLIASIVYS